jgi:hypothetical protein
VAGAAISASGITANGAGAAGSGGAGLGVVAGFCSRRKTADGAKQTDGEHRYEGQVARRGGSLCLFPKQKLSVSFH